MGNRFRSLGLFLGVCVMLLVAGCSGEADLPVEAELYGDGAAIVGVGEGEVPPIEPDVQIGEAKPVEYDTDIEPWLAEIYLDILTENSSNLTDEYLSDGQISGGMGIGEGQIAIMDVVGDETPELLYIYTDLDITNYLKIFTFSEANGVESVLDARIYTAAGGETNYCVYLTRDDELMLYYATGGVASSYGFWPIIQGQNLEIVADYGVYSYSSDFARLYHCDLSYTGEPVYIRYGKEISNEQFDKETKEIMEDIAQVLFHGTEIPGYGLMLYTEYWWQDITPFEAEHLTYAEAVSWLEAKMAG
ncbi:MAG: hypothetical protein FWH32_06735 [Clostridiales bacterium]|nr:hypothetical protein [Clostridiales bacterium]